MDSVPISDERVPATSPVALPISTANMGVTENIMNGARPKHCSDHEYPPPSQRDPISMGKDINPQWSIGLYHLWVWDT